MAEGGEALPLASGRQAVSPTYVMGPCWGCGKLFFFHPHRVPSIPIDHSVSAHGLPPDHGGDPAKAIREPICETCVSLANEIRRRDGREPIEILDGAYGPWEE